MEALVGEMVTGGVTAVAGSTKIRTIQNCVVRRTIESMPMIPSAHYSIKEKSYLDTITYQGFLVRL
jgi:hypothetical protein